MIPVLDLKKQYQSLQKQIEPKVKQVLRSGAYILGPECAAFERKFAGYCGAKYAVAMNSGTDALYLALLALEIGPGDEVITTSYSFIATAETISHAGATPVFVDVRESDATIDVSLIEKKITSRTKAILPVHLYGFVADMDAIRKIAKKHKLAVIEDCAQSIGARLGGKRTGTLSEIGCFSFYPTKNLGAFGDGGTAVTNDQRIFERLKELRTHGSTKKYHYERFGINSRLDEIQAAILRIKLKYIDRWNVKRAKLAARYDAAFKKLKGLALLKAASGTSPVYHLYTLRVLDGRREELMQSLQKKGVQSAIHYPLAMHQQKLYQHAKGLPRFMSTEKGDLGVSESLAEQVFCLPLYPELTSREQDTVIRALNQAVAEKI